MIKAKLVSNIPQSRFRTEIGRIPKVGDVVVIDQGFTFEDGKAGCLVYLDNEDGIFEYEAEVYETEIGGDIYT